MTITPFEKSPFDAIKIAGSETWSARDLMHVMGYSSWQKFETPLKRAMATAKNQGQPVETLFNRMVKNSGGRPAEDYLLTRYAAYLVAMNGDPKMHQVAAAQAYFAIRTREAETKTPAEMSRKEILLLALEAEEKAERLAAENRELAPKAKAYDDFMGATGLFSVKKAADLLTSAGVKIGRNTLFEKLSEIGWIYREGGAWVPKEAYKKQGLITAKAQTRPDYSAIIPGARKLASPKIHLTPKGLHKLRGLLLPPLGEYEVAA